MMPTKSQIDDLIAEIDDVDRARRAGARHDAHQEDGRGPDRLPARGGLGSATCTRTSRRSSGSRSCATCAWASSTCSSGSTCCARDSTCPRCRSSPSSTPTRRASCARRPRSIQTIGRAARNVDGRVVLYADVITDSMRHALAETERRRELQRAYNLEHGIDPQTIRKAVTDLVAQFRAGDRPDRPRPRRFPPGRPPSGAAGPGAAPSSGWRARCPSTRASCPPTNSRG